MAITINQAQGKVPVSIMSIYGKLDASNYQAAIATAQEAYEQGARNLLIDLWDVSFMSSSGIAALHSISLIYRGVTLPDGEGEGWEMFHSLDRDRESGIQEHVKLLKPQARVARTLEKTGLNALFEIYEDQDTAIASFG